jgi:phosphate-selective porin
METFNSKYSATGVAQTLATPSSALAATSMGVQAKAQYVEFMYNITGESWADAYKAGAFGGIKPKTNYMTDYGGVVGNGTGAWQVGYRASKYSTNIPVTGTSATCAATAGAKCEMSVTGTNATGSRVQNAESATTNTYALNWILNSNARIMFNYAETKFAHNVILLDVNQTSGSTISGATPSEKVFSIRTQFNF